VVDAPTPATTAGVDAERKALKVPVLRRLHRVQKYERAVRSRSASVSAKALLRNWFRNSI